MVLVVTGVVSHSCMGNSESNTSMPFCAAESQAWRKPITCCGRHDERNGTAVVAKVPGCGCTIETAENGRSHDADGKVHFMEVQHQLLRQILRECVDIREADILDVECPLHTYGGWAE